MLSRYPIALAKSLELLLPERAALEPVLVTGQRDGE